MPETDQPQRGGTDVAALAAGAIAVVISIAGDPGPYDLINLATGVTLALIIWAYVWPHADRSLKGVAVCAALALAIMPAMGFFIELLMGPPELRGILLCVPFDQNCVGPSEGTGSAVHPVDLVTVWAVVTAGLYARLRWRRR